MFKTAFDRPFYILIGGIVQIKQSDRIVDQIKQFQTHPSVLLSAQPQSFRIFVFDLLSIAFAETDGIRLKSKTDIAAFSGQIQRFSFQKALQLF